MTALGRPGLGRAWAVCLLIITLFQGASPLFGQFGPLGNTTTEELSLSRRLHHESRVDENIQRATDRIQAGEYEEATDILQSVLESTDDYFYVDPMEQAPTGSMLDRVEAILRSLPDDALQAYARRYEPLAEQLLKQARQSPSLTSYLEVPRRYPLTESARTAVREAAGMASDLGETAVASRLLMRLLPDLTTGPERTKMLIEIARGWTLSGQSEQATPMVKELSELARSAPIEFEGKLLTPPASADAAWLNKVFGPVPSFVPRRPPAWRLPGGHPRHWGDGEFASVIDRGSWSNPLVDQYDTRHYEDLPGDPSAKNQTRFQRIQTLVKVLEDRYLKEKALGNQFPLLVGSPLIDRGTVLVQGLGTVKAFDSGTGRLKWSGVVEDNSFLYWVYRCLQEDSSQTGMLDLFLGQRLWLNQTAASLASDGQRVYAITGTGMIGDSQRGSFVPGRVGNTRNELTPSQENRLLAYDIQTGLLKWELGGIATALPVAGDTESAIDQNPRMAGAYFLGAPLAIEGRLYVMAEDRNEVRLLALVPETGAVEWSIPLVNVDQSIDQDEIRRIAGLTPTYAGGLLVCPTAKGIVVVVDPLRRRVKWIHQYSSQKMNAFNMRAFRMRGDRFGNSVERRLTELLRDRRWIDSTPLAVAGRVLVPAVDSHELICLDLETGQVHWKIPRRDGLFLATSTGRHCLVVGERSIQSIRLMSSDASVAWSREIPPPVGRGVLVGGKYLLPTANGEILAIDTAQGKIVGRIAMDSRHTTGTLVAADGQLVMQTPQEIIGFRSLSEIQSEIAAQLKSPATRAQALAEQGILGLTQGRDADAVALLRESLTLQDSDTNRKVLVWSLLDRLKADYAANHPLVAELKELTRDPVQRSVLNRIHAEGLEKSGDYLSAFQEYLQLVPSVRVENLVEDRTEPNAQQVREDRWLRGRLTLLYQLADDSQRQQMQAMLRGQFESLPVPGRIQFADVVGMELAADLYLELALNRALDDYLTARVLWKLSESPQIGQRARATARLVRDELNKDVGPRSNVGRLISRFDQEFASVECEPGTTGEAFLKSLRADAKLAKRLTAIALPGIPQIEPVNDLASSSVLSKRDLLPILGPRHGVLDEWLFTWDGRGSGSIWYSDPMGRDRVQPLNPQSNALQISQLRYIQTDAQLALIVFRDQFTVVNLLDQNSSRQPRYDSLVSPSILNEGFRNMNEPKPAVRDKIYPMASGGYCGNVGPLRFDTLVYQVSEGRDVGDIVAVTPLASGRQNSILWRRSGHPSGCEILADENYVILIPPTQNRLIVLRAADGTQIAERGMPPKWVDRKRAEWGRLFLTQVDDPSNPDQQLFSMYDPVTDKPAWTNPVPKGTLWTPVNGEDLAFLEPGGRLSLIDDQTGGPLWRTQLPAQEIPPQNMRIVCDRDRVYLHTWHSPDKSQDQVRVVNSSRWQLISPGYLVNGLVAALDRRSGEIVWSRKIEQQYYREGIPIGSGLLAYAASRQRADESANPREYCQVELIDRATGKTVYQQELPIRNTEISWKMLHTGVLRIRLIGHDFDLSWKQPEGAAQQSEPVTEPEKPADPPLKLQ